MSSIFPSKEKKELLVNLLLVMGCTKVMVHFAGGGDEGSIESVEVLDKDGNAINIDHVELEWEREIAEADPRTNEWRERTETKLTSMHDILKEITENALEASGLDWYNNEGGQGDFFIYPTETPVRIELDVGINYTATDHHHHDYTDEEE